MKARRKQAEVAESVQDDSQTKITTLEGQVDVLRRQVAGQQAQSIDRNQAYDDVLGREDGFEASVREIVELAMEAEQQGNTPLASRLRTFGDKAGEKYLETNWHAFDRESGRIVRDQEKVRASCRERETALKPFTADLRAGLWDDDLETAEKIIREHLRQSRKDREVLESLAERETEVNARLDLTAADLEDRIAERFPALRHKLLVRVPREVITGDRRRSK